MPQSDLTIPNTPRPQFRQNLNNALQALGTLQAGTTEHTVKYPSQLWADTQNNLLKQRDTSNTTWLTVGRLNQAFFGLTPTDIGATAIASNLSDVPNKATARNNLGVTSAAKNMVINGGFAINQRGGVSYSLSGNTFTVDRWRILNTPGSGGTTATGSVTQQLFSPGQTQVPGEPATFIRITNTTTGSALGLDSFAAFQSNLEDVRTFAGQTCTLSFWARSTIAAKTLGVELAQNFGTGGSGFVSTGGQLVTLSSTWQQFTKTFTVPSISGKTIGTGTFLSLVFWLQAGSNNSSRAGGSFGWQNTGDIEIANVQLEQGSLATPFERRLVADELLYCQRYYEECYSAVDGYGTPGTTLRGAIQYKVEKRAAPAITPTAPYLGNCSFNSLQSNTTKSVVATINVTATGNAFSDIFIKADAEL